VPRNLSSRIEQLEERALNAGAARQTQPEPWTKQRTAKALSALRLAGEYDSWRHAGLSLELRLALARDDNVRVHAKPRPHWSPSRRQEAPGAWVSIWPAVCAREFEIQILKRDARIDEETAQFLRDNIHQHFFASPDDIPAAACEPLAELPHHIDFDESAALSTARLQCPDFDSLSLEEQLKYREEDLLKETDDLLAQTIKCQIKALKQKIAECGTKADRG
jgi:hypothetical protein